MTVMSLVAGVDSSTQSCTIVIRDAATGEHVRSGRRAAPARHRGRPGGLVGRAAGRAGAGGRPRRRRAIAVAGQQHGMVCLDADGEVVRPALLWNDTRSAQAATDLVTELGAQEWADATGTLPVASITATKLRWLATHEPENAARTAAVCLPHDWLTWKLRGTGALDDLVTDRGDASGTGYFSAADNAYRPDLLELAFGRSDLVLPRVLGPGEAAGRTPDGVLHRPRHRRQRGRRARARGRSGRHRGVVGHVRRRVRGEPHPHRRSHRHHRRLRLRERRVPPAGVHAQRGPGARRGHPRAGRRPRGPGEARPRRPGGRGRPGARAVPGGRAHAEQARLHRRAARPHARHVDARAHGAGRRRGAAVRARRRGRRPARGERAGRAGDPGGRGGPVGGRRPDRARGARAPGRPADARRVRRGRGRATGGLGAVRGGGRRRTGRRPGRSGSPPSPRRTCASATPRPATSR